MRWNALLMASETESNVSAYLNLLSAPDNMQPLR